MEICGAEGAEFSCEFKCNFLLVFFSFFFLTLKLILGCTGACLEGDKFWATKSNWWLGE